MKAKSKATCATHALVGWAGMHNLVYWYVGVATAGDDS
jgi:hypothetical protein